MSKDAANEIIEVVKKYYEYKLKDLVDIIWNYNIDTEKDRNKLFYAKLVNVNLIFYSYLF